MILKKHLLPIFLTVIFLFSAVYFNRHLFLKKSDSQTIVFKENLDLGGKKEIEEKNFSSGEKQNYKPSDQEVKILISEIQISPIKERFIELYNPNSADVDLSGWYIQRKTESASSWNSFVSSTRLKGKTIKAKSHFLIASSLEKADIVFKMTLTQNNSLVLKNHKRKIIDLVGWGERSQEFEKSPALNPEIQKSIQRKRDQKTGDYKDSGNNALDFIIAPPTPGNF